MKLTKITTGFVIQTFDTDVRNWISQEFVAGSECDYEKDGSDIDSEEFTELAVGPNQDEPYLPFDMVQPLDKTEQRM